MYNEGHGLPYRSGWQLISISRTNIARQVYGKPTDGRNCRVPIRTTRRRQLAQCRYDCLRDSSRRHDAMYVGMGRCIDSGMSRDKNVGGQRLLTYRATQLIVVLNGLTGT